MNIMKFYSTKIYVLTKQLEYQKQQVKTLTIKFNDNETKVKGVVAKLKQFTEKSQIEHVIYGKQYRDSKRIFQ